MASFPPPASHLAGPFSPCGFSLQPDGLDFLTWWLSPQGGQWKLLGLSGPQDQHPRMSLPPHSAVGASPRAGPDCRAGQGDSASWSEEQHPDIVRKKSRWGRGLLLCFAFFFSVSFFYCGKTCIKFTILTLLKHSVNRSVALRYSHCCAAITTIHLQTLFKSP